ncbi:hypothetical protein TsFJ059_000165 [Trichoderma semiorbis]|uniref:Oxidoreductase acuF-like C2H2 type zinc-finger domain-containing protein n=1 Tax=Trichoderma semiorbis TaxID=1491008 RepID=A0A9P8I0Q4_9HYPO|nr:hypothetical protein TsFJ059_000165 [Trichoderma semiorbis]
MTDTSTTTGPNKKTVAAAANQCLESFNKCLLQQSSIHPREFSLVEDQVARFSTWTSGIGVFAPGRASMDHRLRYAPEVQSITISLLESLNYRIQKLLELLHGHINGSETHISSILDERLGKLLDYIAAEISHLNKMSNIIRKASQDSQNIQARDFHMTDEEGNDVQPILLSHYKRYIGEGFPTASVTIQQRLADAMILRRKRILYRRSRYGGTAIQLPEVEKKASITLPDSLLPLKDNQMAIAPSRIKSATTLQPEKFKMAASSPSVVSVTMTVALSNHEALKFPTAPGLHDKRKRLSTEEQLSKVLKPDVPAIGEVTCPYCFYTLSLKEVFNEKKWHNHVKNDLDPYVCLFEECGEPDELYKHSEKWLSHMHQHIQRWRCPSHRELGLFQTCEEYMQHVRDVHDTKLNDSKLRALANRNARSLPKLFMSCPLCGKNESEIGTRLTDHITGHLRSLAIMSLPVHYDEDIPGDVGSDGNSSSNSQPRSRSTINLLDDENIVVIRSAINGKLYDMAEPSIAVDAATSDEEDSVDMLFQGDDTHSDLDRHPEHVRAEKAGIISPELNNEQNDISSNIPLEDGTNSGLDMDSDDTDMEDPQLEQTQAPQEHSDEVAAPPQPAQQSNQRTGPKPLNFTPLTPQQEASLIPEQRARYNQILKDHGIIPAASTEAGSDTISRLKLIGLEEQRQFSQEQIVDIPMGPEEYAETAQRLKRIVSDMSKIGRALSKWYYITQDDARAKMFFRIRLRVIKQHVDGVQMEVMKDVFSIRSSDLDQARAMFESMAKDLADHRKHTGKVEDGASKN